MQDQLDNALDGAQSIIYADEGSLPFGPNSFQARNEDGLKKTLEVAKRYPSIRRVILVTSQAAGPFASAAQVASTPKSITSNLLALIARRLRILSFGVCLPTRSCF